MSKSGTLSFYTIGSEFTTLVRDLIAEGAFYNAYTILKDGGFDDSKIRLFFMNGLKFEGDTREGNGLDVIEDKSFTEEEFIAHIVIAIRTLISFEEIYFEDVFFMDSDPKPLDDPKILKHLDCLFKAIPKSMLLSMCLPLILNDNGFDLREGIGPRFDGVILKDGRIVECGYQQHRDLYPVLYKLGLVSEPSWTECTDSLHISSGQASGKIAFELKHWDEDRDRGIKISEAMLKTIRNNCDNIEFYGYGSKKVMAILANFYEEDAAKGGKYGKLHFLKNCYPEINLPKFSTEEIPGVKNCIRTSPKLSIAGLLNSKFDINENSIKEIEADWERYKSVVGQVKYLDGKVKDTNKLNYFYQEYLEGPNGVAHCRDKTFTYSCSKNRGDIVDGKKGNYVLHIEHEIELKRILEKLHKDIERDIQVEFVISDDKLYIVQLRFLEKAREYRPYVIDHTKVVVSGRSFSMGRTEEITKEDVLVIDEDCESEEVVGKKAIIVRNNTEFSHALALSYSLRIPSIYNVGDNFELPEKFIIDTKGRDGYILNI